MTKTPKEKAIEIYDCNIPEDIVYCAIHNFFEANKPNETGFKKLAILMVKWCNAQKQEEAKQIFEEIEMLIGYKLLKDRNNRLKELKKKYLK